MANISSYLTKDHSLHIWDIIKPTRSHSTIHDLCRCLWQGHLLWLGGMWSSRDCGSVSLQPAPDGLGRAGLRCWDFTLEWSVNVPIFHITQLLGIFHLQQISKGDVKHCQIPKRKFTDPCILSDLWTNTCKLCVGGFKTSDWTLYCIVLLTWDILGWWSTKISWIIIPRYPKYDPTICHPMGYIFIIYIYIYYIYTYIYIYGGFLR